MKIGGDNSYQKYVITYNNVYKYYVIIMKELINVDDYYQAKRLKNPFLHRRTYVIIYVMESGEMMVLRTQKVRLYPNKTMQKVLNDLCDYRRYCWNAGLA